VELPIQYQGCFGTASARVLFGRNVLEAGLRVQHKGVVRRLLHRDHWLYHVDWLSIPGSPIYLLDDLILWI